MPRTLTLVQHQYDALNRLAASTPSAQDTALRFYRKDRLVTEVQGTVKRGILRHENLVLAQQQHRCSTAAQKGLLATDQQGSVLSVQTATQLHPLAYTPYGHRSPANDLLSLLGFNGEFPDAVTGWYLLGTGYHRPFNPVLMRFICTDSWSPFKEGGLNTYAYCEGDPVNQKDPEGHMSVKQLVALFDAKQAPQSLPTVNPSRARGGMPKKINKLATDILTYEDTSSSGNLRLTIDAHGVKAPGSKAFMVHNGGNLLNPKQLHAKLLSNGIKLDSYNSLRLLVCDSTTYGTKSFAASFAKITSKPTKGYIGTVTPLKNRDLRDILGIIRLGEAKRNVERIGSIIDKTGNFQPVKFTKSGKIIP
ncbi:hypothetical protein PS918_05777 [Pseudomonas fluorescens]|uniref:RHS repeat-associated core domain-containing protein n=1 Tax=Pseudomonas fluorescens TaxID=294 RepID=A0A5E7UZH7_PSEFL|nr:RHS repeat-associated core domain-containing protein [Pseudomonas fluorescens]VVQ14818.1 hypothetical protein PS918_05777 [Pseudomonas fluorescens]